MFQTKKNILEIQLNVMATVNVYLTANGYILSKEDRFDDEEAFLLQWSNLKTNHTFQLLWDIREKWFNLGEFNDNSSLKYIDSIDIQLFPFKVNKLFFKTRYKERYTEKIKSKIETTLKAIHNETGS